MTANFNRLRNSGFSLIELMVGMAIGLLCTLVIATVLSSSEGLRRGVTSGTDAQIAGGMSIFALQRDIASAGYGFASESNAVGCPLQARFNGAPALELPARLAPIFITQGPAGASDEIRVISSSKGIDPERGSLIGFTVPLRIAAHGNAGAGAQPGYTVGDQRYQVATPLGFAQGDLVIAVPEPASAPGVELPCELFEINAPVPTVAAAASIGATIPRLNDASRWNPPNFPTTQMVTGTDSTIGAFLVNLGFFSDRIYRVSADRRLQVAILNTPNNLTRTVREVQGDVVLLKAMYGRDTDGDQAVDIYDYTTPASQPEWQNVFSIRLAIVARSAHYSKEDVTVSEPLWDVGNAISVAGAVACGSSRCITLKIADVSSDWKKYRYKVFDTVIPLRNQRFRSGAVIPPPSAPSGAGSS